MKTSSVAILCIGLCMAGCSVAPPTATPLQIQAFQSHEFETQKRVAFGAALSVFQDLGYIVQSADLDTGFITAASPAGSKFNWWELLDDSSSSAQTRATAFVEEIRSGFVTVRLNFVESKRLSSKEGQTTDRDTPILDPKAYQVAFDKIGDAIFVRSATR
jgi:hypothetical protein